MLLLFLEVICTPVKPTKGNNDFQRQKGLDIDLNLPPPVEEEKEHKIRKSSTKEMKKIYNARQNAKRKERKRIDPEYAKKRHEIEVRAKQKWTKKLAEANGGDKKVAEEKMKAYQHNYYLKRIGMFGGRPSRKEQEVAETFKKISKGEHVPEEQHQRALDHRKKRRMIQKASVLRIKQRGAQAQAHVQTRPEQIHE